MQCSMVIRYLLNPALLWKQIQKLEGQISLIQISNVLSYHQHLPEIQKLRSLQILLHYLLRLRRDPLRWCPEAEAGWAQP